MSEKHYDISYLEGTTRRLRELKEQSYAALQHIQQGVVLELGCGTGADALRLAELAGPEVRVVGIDHDAAMVEKARSMAGDRPNISFLQADARTISFGNETVDAIRTERLVQHLEHPEETFAEIHRVLKPGAPVVIVETDWENFTLYNGDRDIRRRLGRYLVEDKINNGYAARNLTQYLEQNSFSGIKVQVFPFELRAVEQMYAYLMVNQSLGEMKAKGLLSSAEYDTFIQQLADADSRGYFSCTINLVIVSATK